MPRPTTSPPGHRPATSRRSALAALGAGVLLTLVLALASAPAYAHDELRSSNPRDGDTLAQPPAQVVLTFGEAPVEIGAQVVVTGPDGPVSSGSPRIQGKDVIQVVRPGAPAGRYTVEWRVTSADGHPVSGRLGFTASAAGGSSPSAAATSSPAPAPGEAPRGEPLVPSWAWIIAGVIVIAAAIRVNRRARAADKQED